MWIRRTHKNQKEHYVVDTGNGQRLKIYGTRGYWSWSKAYNDYYHRRKNGTYKWASNTREMDEARAYAELSRQADTSGTARGIRISFSKAPLSLSLLNRRITPGSGNMLASFEHPMVSDPYTISYSPTFRSAGGAKLGYVEDPQDELDAYHMSFLLRSEEHNPRLTGGIPIHGVSLSKEKGIFAPAVGTRTRQVSLSKVAADTRVISDIRIVVHDASSHAKSLKTTRNHWSIYLILQNQTGTVRVNMTISESDTSILEWTLLSYPLSLSQIRVWDFKVVPKITVARFYRLIHDNRRHRYAMLKGGNGDECRFWIYAVIADLARQRWLENRQAREEMWDYLNHFYSFGGTSRPIGMVAGKFY